MDWRWCLLALLPSRRHGPGCFAPKAVHFGNGIEPAPPLRYALAIAPRQPAASLEIYAAELREAVAGHVRHGLRQFQRDVADERLAAAFGSFHFDEERFGEHGSEGSHAEQYHGLRAGWHFAAASSPARDLLFAGVATVGKHVERAAHQPVGEMQRQRVVAKQEDAQIADAPHEG